MNKNSTEAQLQLVEKILNLEARSGFQDKAVVGGLDRFLERVNSDQVTRLRLRILGNHGMLNVAYRELTLPQRSAWVKEAQRLLGMEEKTPRKVKDVFTLDSPVNTLSSVSIANAEKLKRLRVKTVRDLLYLFPNRHLDYSNRCAVAELRPGIDQTVVVSLWEVYERRLGRGGRLQSTEAVVGDETGNIRVVWFGQRYLVRTLQRWLTAAQSKPGTDVKLVLSGKIKVYSGRRQFESPDWEVLEDQDTASLVHTGRLVPIYPATDGLQSQRVLRRMVREVMDKVLGSSTQPSMLPLSDPIPAEVIQRHKLIPLAEAITQFHYPDSPEDHGRARRRIAFDELLILQLAMAIKRQSAGPAEMGVRLLPTPKVLETFYQSLPFSLTKGQSNAIADGIRDMQSGGQAMSRLLQGEVGSGKTVVALALLLMAVANGYQGVFMAPTEVLAEQHYLNVSNLLSGFGKPAQEAYSFAVHVEPHPRPINIGLLMGSTPAPVRRDLISRIREGTLDLLVGTHAVIQQGVEIPNLALGVVDEQHRFGVMQRAALRGKGQQPHLLAMSATPIPRTLALTLYGDLEISSIPELPSGRQPIQTLYVPRESWDRAEKFVIAQVQEGRQVFVVCPLIEESESIQAKAATIEYERLRTGSLADLNVGLLHGRMPLREKQAVMDNFRDGSLDVLVATPVIEVGIDVPNAAVMLIQGADRFGLSQLHQLRGRVGRGPHKSYCLLLADEPSDEARERLEKLVKNSDGFDIAEADLQLRGPGDFFGTRQSGLPTLRVARLSDRDLLAEAKDEARRMVDGKSEVLDKGNLAETVRRYIEQVVEEVG